jgi:hypothetical protein
MTLLSSLELLFERKTDYRKLGKALRIAPRVGGRAGDYHENVRGIPECCLL